MQDHFFPCTEYHVENHLSAKFNRLLPQVMPLWSSDPVEQEYLSAYICAGVNAIIHTWVARDFSESVDQVVRMAMRSQGVLSPIP